MLKRSSNDELLSFIRLDISKQIIPAKISKVSDSQSGEKGTSRQDVDCSGNCVVTNPGRVLLCQAAMLLSLVV